MPALPNSPGLVAEETPTSDLHPSRAQAAADVEHAVGHEETADARARAESSQRDGPHVSVVEQHRCAGDDEFGSYATRA